jgi:hypothetical protein
MNHLVDNDFIGQDGFEIQFKRDVSGHWVYEDGFAEMHQAVTHVVEKQRRSHPTWALFVRIVNRRTGKTVAGWFKGKKVFL